MALNYLKIKLYYNSLLRKTVDLGKRIELLVEKNLQKQEQPVNKINPFEHILKFATILTICAFLYWRIFFETIGVDYFLFFFSFEDAPYILYYKATFYTYGLMLILFFVWPYLLCLTNQYVKFLISVTILAILCYLMVRGDQFNITHGIILFLLLLATMVMYILWDKNAIYGSFVILTFFLSISAENDAKTAMEDPLHVTLVAKDGKTIVHRSEKDRYLITATSKFFIIYDKRNKIVEKYYRDEVK